MYLGGRPKKERNFKCRLLLKKTGGNAVATSHQLFIASGERGRKTSQEWKNYQGESEEESSGWAKEEERREGEWSTSVLSGLGSDAQNCTK